MRCRQRPRRGVLGTLAAAESASPGVSLAPDGQLDDVSTVALTEWCRSRAAMSSISTSVPKRPVVLNSAAMDRACVSDRLCTSRRARRAGTVLASGSVRRSLAGPCSAKRTWRISSGVASPLSCSHQATGQDRQCPSAPHHRRPRSMNWPVSSISTPLHTSHRAVIFAPWVITVLLNIGPRPGWCRNSSPFVEFISSPSSLAAGTVRSRYRGASLSAWADGPWSGWLRGGTDAADVGRPAFAQRQGQGLPELTVLRLQLPVALGGCLQTSQKGGIGGPLQSGTCRAAGICRWRARSRSNSALRSCWL